MYRFAFKDNLHGNQARSVKTVPGEVDFHHGSERKALALLPARRRAKNKLVDYKSAYKRICVCLLPACVALGLN